MNIKNYIPFIFRCVALGLSVAACVLMTMEMLDVENLHKFLLGAVLCLSVGCLDAPKK